MQVLPVLPVLPVPPVPPVPPVLPVLPALPAGATAAAGTSSRSTAMPSGGSYECIFAGSNPIPEPVFEILLSKDKPFNAESNIGYQM